MSSILQSPTTSPGRFGPYGGRYVPETLMVPLLELERAYELAKSDAAFQAQLQDLLKNFAGPPHAAAICLAAHRTSRRTAHLPQARRSAAHRRAQDQQRHWPGAAGRKNGQAAHRRRNRRRPARRRLRHHRRASWPGMRRVHGHGRHGAPGAQRCAHAHARRASRRRRCRQPHAQGRHQRSHARLGDQRPHHALSSRLRSRARIRTQRWCAIFSPSSAAKRASKSSQPSSRLPTHLYACVGGGSNAIGLFHAFLRDAA